MTTYTISYTVSYTDGRKSKEYDDMDDAIASLEGDVEIGDEEPNGLLTEDGQPMRRLVWDSEEASANDAGANAIASIDWVEPRRPWR